MEINTRIFGKIEVPDDRIILFDRGIIGFPELRRFTLLHDGEQDNVAGIRFLQSVEEPKFAMPVMDPLIIKPDYKPMLDMEFVEQLGLGNINDDNILVVVTVTVPHDLEKMTVNLQGPIIINSDEKKACQVILDEYPVRYPIYDILKSGKAGE